MELPLPLKGILVQVIYGDSAYSISIIFAFSYRKYVYPNVSISR